MILVLVFLSLFICIFLDFLYSFFDFYRLYHLLCYLFISLFYTGPMLIAVFMTEMVVLHKYVFSIINIILIQSCEYIFLTTFLRLKLNYQEAFTLDCLHY